MRTVFTTLAALALCGVAYVFHAQTRGAAPLPPVSRVPGLIVALLPAKHAADDVDDRVQALMTRVDQALRKVQSLTAGVNIVDTVLPDASNKNRSLPPEKSSGSVAFKRSNLFRFEQRDSAGKVSGIDILDGKSLWKVYPNTPHSPYAAGLFSL